MKKYCISHEILSYDKKPLGVGSELFLFLIKTLKKKIKVVSKFSDDGKCPDGKITVLGSKPYLILNPSYVCCLIWITYSSFVFTCKKEYNHMCPIGLWQGLNEITLWYTWLIHSRHSVNVTSFFSPFHSTEKWGRWVLPYRSAR